MKEEVQRPVFGERSENRSRPTSGIETAVELTGSVSAQANVALIEDVPPNGGYGWVCTACVFLFNAHTWGINSAWAIFLSYYLEHSTFPEATQLEYALIGGLSVSQALVITPVVALSIRRFGTTTTLLIGTLLVFVALLGASFASRVWQLVLSQGVCFGFGMGFIYIPAASVLPQWFTTKRSLAVGIASSGAGLGGVAYNLIAGVAIRRIGLQWTYRLLAFCSLLVNSVCSLLARDRNKFVKPKQGSFDYRELAHVEVFLITIWGFLSELGYIVLLYSLPHYATTIGLTQGQGSVVGAMLNVSLGRGRPFVGYASDRLGRINIAMIMTASCGIFCLALWVPAHSYALLLVFALLAGFGCGTFWGTISAVAAEVVGLQRLPTAFGAICICLVAPTTFAEPIGLKLVAVSGYLTSQVFVGLMFLLAASSLWLLRSWKIAEVEQKARNEEDSRVIVGARIEVGLAWLSLRKLFKAGRV